MSSDDRTNYAILLREAVERVNEIILEKDEDIVINLILYPEDYPNRLDVQILQEL